MQTFLETQLLGNVILVVPVTREVYLGPSKQSWLSQVTSALSPSPIHLLFLYSLSLKFPVRWHQFREA